MELVIKKQKQFEQNDSSIVHVYKQQADQLGIEGLYMELVF